MAAGIDELCVAQAHRQCALVHARDERDAEIVGDRAAGVVRGAHHHRCEQGTYAELLACLEADAAPGLARCRAAHGDHVVQVPRLEGDQCAHHLGEARRRHAQLLVAGPDDDAVALYEIRISDARKAILRRGHRARGEEGCDGEYFPNRPLSLPGPSFTPGVAGACDVLKPQNALGSGSRCAAGMGFSLPSLSSSVRTASAFVAKLKPASVCRFWQNSLCFASQKALPSGGRATISRDFASAICSGWHTMLEATSLSRQRGFTSFW